MRSSITPIASRAGIAAVAGMALIVGASPLLTSASDHLDAPAAKADHRVDITDVYAFKAGAGKTTLVLNVDGLLTPADGKTASFRKDALYELKIDRNQDGKADLAYRVRFSSPITNGDGSKTQAYVVRRAAGVAAARNVWSGKVVATGLTTPYKHGVKVAHVMGGGAVFAGVRDDPFFFDLPGFVEFKSQLLGGSTNLGTLLGGFTGTDTFAGTNVLSIAIRLPGRQARRHRQLDRRVRDHLHPVQRRLEADRPRRPSGDQHRVQRADPAGDLGLQRAREGRLQRPAPVRGPLDHHRQRDDGAQRDRQRADGQRRHRVHAGRGLGDRRRSCCPTSSRSRSAAPPRSPRARSLGTLALNGRKLGDDVIDAEFALLTNFVITTGDGVAANDKAFSSAFPYLASPH